MRRIARLRRQHQRPASNNNSFFCLQLRDTLRATSSPPQPSDPPHPCCYPFNPCSKERGSPPRVPGACLPNAPRDKPEELADAATRRLWLKQTQYRGARPHETRPRRTPELVAVDARRDG